MEPTMSMADYCASVTLLGFTICVYVLLVMIIRGKW